MNFTLPFWWIIFGLGILWIIKPSIFRNMIPMFKHGGDWWPSPLLIAFGFTGISSEWFLNWWLVNQNMGIVFLTLAGIFTISAYFGHKFNLFYIFYLQPYISNLIKAFLSLLK